MLKKLALCSAITTTLLSGNVLADSDATTVLPHQLTAVIPVNYTVAITPDTGTMRVAGSETIMLNVLKTSSKIQFSSANQKICRVRFDGKPVQDVDIGADNHLVTIHLKSPARVGNHRLSFSFVGNIEHTLHGIFVQPYTKHNGTSGQFLTATFEGSDTQKVFPGWEQTSFSAPVRLSVTVPSTWTSWASMPIEHQETHGEFTTIAFKATSDLGNHLMEFSGGSLLQSSTNIATEN